MGAIVSKLHNVPSKHQSLCHTQDRAAARRCTLYLTKQQRKPNRHSPPRKAVAPAFTRKRRTLLQPNEVVFFTCNPCFSTFPKNHHEISDGKLVSCSKSHHSLQPSKHSCHASHVHGTFSRTWGGSRSKRADVQGLSQTLMHTQPRII